MSCARALPHDICFPPFIFLCKFKDLICYALLMTFCHPLAGTIAAEAAFWGKKCFVSRKRGRFRILKTPCVDPGKRQATSGAASTGVVNLEAFPEVAKTNRFYNRFQNTSLQAFILHRDGLQRRQEPFLWAISMTWHRREHGCLVAGLNVAFLQLKSASKLEDFIHARKFTRKSFSKRKLIVRDKSSMRHCHGNRRHNQSKKDCGEENPCLVWFAASLQSYELVLKAPRAHISVHSSIS